MNKEFTIRDEEITKRYTHYKNFTFIIENEKGNKTVWLKHNDCIMQMYLFGGKITFDEIDGRIFAYKEKYIKEYIEEVSK